MRKPLSLMTGLHLDVIPINFTPIRTTQQAGILTEPRALHTFVGSCLATKVFIGNLPAMGRGWVIIK